MKAVRPFAYCLWHQSCEVYCFGSLTYGDVYKEVIAISKMEKTAQNRHQGGGALLVAILLPLVDGNAHSDLEGNFVSCSWLR